MSVRSLRLLVVQCASGSVRISLCLLLCLLPWSANQINSKIKTAANAASSWAAATTASAVVPYSAPPDYIKAFSKALSGEQGSAGSKGTNTQLK